MHVRMHIIFVICNTIEDCQTADMLQTTGVIGNMVQGTLHEAGRTHPDFRPIPDFSGPVID